MLSDDPDLPGAADLLGPNAAAVLAPAVEGAGGRLRSAVATQVRYDPGRRVTVRYGAEVEWADGTQRTETFGALLQAEPVPEGLAVVEGDDGTRVGVWRYPHDPFLPGLPHAAYPHGARAILRELGVTAGEVTVEPVVYRPGSRAVVRMRADRATVYVKILRPSDVAPLRALHDAFVDAVPVPRCIGWSEPLGLVAFPALPGQPLTRPLVDGGRLPAPRELLDLLERVRAVPVPSAGGDRRALDTYARLLCVALPGEGARISELAGRAIELGTDVDGTVHGDFYEGQVLVTDGTVTGLLDIDGARAGDVLDDPATLIGHLVGLGHVHPKSAPRIAAYRDELLREPTLAADASRLRSAVTGVLLGLATTPFRRQERDWAERTRGWLDLASSWSTGGVPAA